MSVQMRKFYLKYVCIFIQNIYITNFRELIVCFLMTFSDILAVISFLLSFYLPPLPRMALLLISLDISPVPRYSPSLLLPHPPVPAMSHCFTFLVSEVSPEYMFTSEELEFGASHEREHLFAFLDVGYRSQYEIF